LQLIKEQKEALKIKEEEEELRKIREMSVFRASAIRKYKSIDTSHIPDKQLTIPQPPRLATMDRASLKEESGGRH